jgi:hypothetical protein
MRRGTLLRGRRTVLRGRRAVLCGRCTMLCGRCTMLRRRRALRCRRWLITLRQSKAWNCQQSPRDKKPFQTFHTIPQCAHSDPSHPCDVLFQNLHSGPSDSHILPFSCHRFNEFVMAAGPRGAACFRRIASASSSIPTCRDAADLSKSPRKFLSRSAKGRPTRFGVSGVPWRRALSVRRPILGGNLRPDGIEPLAIALDVHRKAVHVGIEARAEASAVLLRAVGENGHLLGRENQP